MTRLSGITAILEATSLHALALTSLNRRLRLRGLQATTTAEVERLGLPILVSKGRHGTVKAITVFLDEAAKSGYWRQS